MTYDNNELVHYGVKGMRWGVRKKYYKSYMDDDRVIRKGTSIQNISRNEPRKIKSNAPVYGAHTTHDRNVYAGLYANTIRWMGDKAIKNELEITSDVKIPSQKKAVNTFMEMYNKDPQGISRSIGNAYAECIAFNKIDVIRNWNANRITNKFSKKGEDWIESKGYLLFNQSMTADKESKARTEYYRLLSKKGYDAISDINDVQSGYNSDDPIIFINPPKNLKNVKSSELTYDDVELALARYNYDEARKNKKSVYSILSGEYRTAKKELKRVESKYA